MYYESDIISCLNAINQTLKSNTDWIQNLLITISGILVGFFLNEYKNRQGKISIKCVDNTVFRILKEDKLGDIEYARSFSDATELRLNITLEIYNTYSCRKILRDVHFSIKTKYKKYYRITYIDIQNNDLDLSNNLIIDTKSIKNRNLIATIKEKKILNQLIDPFYIYFNYIDENERKIRIKVIKSSEFCYSTVDSTNKCNS